jgi:hypothetical protein
MPCELLKIGEVSARIGAREYRIIREAELRLEKNPRPESRNGGRVFQKGDRVHIKKGHSSSFLAWSALAANSSASNAFWTCSAGELERRFPSTMSRRRAPGWLEFRYLKRSPRYGLRREKLRATEAD